MQLVNSDSTQPRVHGRATDIPPKDGFLSRLGPKIAGMIHV